MKCNDFATNAMLYAVALFSILCGGIGFAFVMRFFVRLVIG